MSAQRVYWLYRPQEKRLNSFIVRLRQQGNTVKTQRKHSENTVKAGKRENNAVVITVWYVAPWMHVNQYYISNDVFFPTNQNRQSELVFLLSNYAWSGRYCLSEWTQFDYKDWTRVFFV